MASEQMNFMIKVMKQMMEQRGMPMFGAEINPVILRQNIEAAQSRMPDEPGVTYLPERFGNMDAELSMPENARDDAIIIYIHGGGLICGNAYTSRGYASMLAGETKIPVYSFSYRLAPEDPYPAAVDDCYLAYLEVLKKHLGLPVFLIGESGGAYLSIVTALKARDNQVQIPAGVIPYSPVIDLSGKLNRDREGCKDFTVTQEGLVCLADMYCPDVNSRTDPYVSPYYADYTGMSPLLLAWDESETLAPDSEVVRDKALTAGVEVQWKSYPDCFHAFATTGRGTPESMEILQDTKTFIEKHI